MPTTQDRTGRLLRARGPATVVLAGLLCATGCTRFTYDRVKLGETTAEQLPSILGKDSRLTPTWHVASEFSKLPLSMRTAAVLVNAQGRTLGKSMSEMRRTHCLLFIIASWHERVETRLTKADMEKLQRAYSQQAGDDPASLAGSAPACSQPATTQKTWPSDPLSLLIAFQEYRPNQLAASSQPTAAQVRHFSREQVPLALLLSLQVHMPFNSSPSVSREDGLAVSIAAIMMRSLVFQIFEEDVDRLLVEADARRLCSTPAPVEIRVGPWCVRKRASDDYELTLEITKLAPPWALPCPSRPSAKEAEASRERERDETTTQPDADLPSS
jgi:hypothetical protein